jgi:hypothetical protein
MQKDLDETSYKSFVGGMSQQNHPKTWTLEVGTVGHAPAKFVASGQPSGRQREIPGGVF